MPVRCAQFGQPRSRRSAAFTPLTRRSDSGTLARHGQAPAHCWFGEPHAARYRGSGGRRPGGVRPCLAASWQLAAGACAVRYLAAHGSAQPVPRSVASSARDHERFGRRPCRPCARCRGYACGGRTRWGGSCCNRRITETSTRGHIARSLSGSDRRSRGRNAAGQRRSFGIPAGARSTDLARTTLAERSER